MEGAIDPCREPAPDQRCQLSITGRSPLVLGHGARLDNASISYETWGTPAADGSNAVLLLHGFSGDSHAAGAAGGAHPSPGWWDGLLGPGKAIDTDRFFILCPNALGGCHGTTGPASLAPDGRPYGSRFPDLTIRDLVAAEQCWADILGIRRWAAVIGGSLGGMRALEWAISRPKAIERLVLLATTGACSPENRAFHNTQIRAIQLDPNFCGGDYYNDPSGGPWRGLALARSIGRLTYGCEQELNERFATGRGEAVEAFLKSDGEALCRRFDANSYIVLTKAMSQHDVGLDRGGIKAALSTISCPTTVISIDSDRLFPPYQQQLLANNISGSVHYSTIHSNLGHDGFLEEQNQLIPALTKALN